MIERWLEATPFRIGEIAVERSAAGAFALSHRDDVGRAELVEYGKPDDATEIARFADDGKYRPLKTAPNLRHGWRLILRNAGELELAIDLFYPARLATLAAWQTGALVTTPFRETLGRQSGMYRVAARISDEDADALVGNFCRSDGGCLRTILWKRDSAGILPSTLLPLTKFDPQVDQTGRGEPCLPMLCQEGCNLLVAEAREVVKRTTK